MQDPGSHTMVFGGCYTCMDDGSSVCVTPFAPFTIRLMDRDGRILLTTAVHLPSRPLHPPAARVRTAFRRSVELDVNTTDTDGSMLSAVVTAVSHDLLPTHTIVTSFSVGALTSSVLTLRNLRAFRVYNISIFLENQFAAGPTRHFVLQTEPDVPSTPRDVTVSGTTLSWEPPTELNGVMTSYLVTWISTNVSVSLLPSSVTLELESVTNITNDVMFNVYVQACNAVGCSVRAAPQPNQSSTGQTNDVLSQKWVVVLASMLSLLCLLVVVAWKRRRAKRQLLYVPHDEFELSCDLIESNACIGKGQQGLVYQGVSSPS